MPTPDEAAGHRVAALEHDAAEVDPRPRRGDDDDPALVGPESGNGRDKPDLALNLGAGTGGPDARSSAIGDRGGQRGRSAERER